MQNTTGNKPEGLNPSNQERWHATDEIGELRHAPVNLYDQFHRPKNKVDNEQEVS